MIERRRLYSVSELIDRGWTRSAIEKFLPAVPDDLRDNPHYARAGSPMKFWLKGRVYRVEKTKRFLSWKSGTENRKQAAARAVATKVSRMIARTETCQITIQRDRTLKEIYELAWRTHGGNYAGDPGEFRWSRTTAENCIRHKLTNYESLWKIMNRGETGQPAYAVLRERVDALIEEVYGKILDSIQG